MCCRKVNIVVFTAADVTFLCEVSTFLQQQSQLLVMDCFHDLYIVHSASSPIVVLGLRLTKLF